MGAIDDKYRSVLSHSHAVGDLVEVYLNEEDLNRFIVGLVESVTSETFALQALDTEGEFDGREVCRIDEIVRLHVGGDYLESLKLLHESRGQIFKKEPEPADSYGQLDIPTSLTFARDKRILVSVHDYDKDQTMGFVADLGDDWVQIEPILRDGRSNGFTIFRVEDIIRVSIGGKREQARGFVHQSRLGL